MNGSNSFNHNQKHDLVSPCNITHVYWGKVQNKCFIQLHNSYDIEKWIHLLMLSFFKLHIMTLDNHLITLIFLLICQTVVQAHILFQEIWLAWIWHSKTGFTACLWWMFNLVSFWFFIRFCIISWIVHAFYLVLNYWIICWRKDA